MMEMNSLRRMDSTKTSRSLFHDSTRDIDGFVQKRTRFSIGFEDMEHGIVLKEEDVQKLRGDGTWIERKLKLTNDFLLFENDEHAVDSIPLHEITSAHPRANVHGVGSKKSLLEKTGSGAVVKSMLTPNGNGNSANSFDSHAGQDMEITTTLEGFNSGRSYVVRCPTKESCRTWTETLTKMSKERAKLVTKSSQLAEWRAWARRTFYSLPFQFIVILLITANFIINCFDAQYHPEEGTRARWLIDAADFIFIGIFALELAFNAFGHWFWSFVQDGWSVFDLVVIAASVAALVFDEIPGVSILRSVRAFRILRLIGRFNALKRMINAIIISLIPVLNAFLIGLLITLIYSILGVNLFAARSESNFSTFARAMFTLFMLMAFDKWPDDLPGFDENGKLDWSVILFLFTFVVIISWTLLQVVVAILLDNFIAATSTEKQRRAVEKQRKARIIGHALDPILEMLAATYDTTYDLSKRIEQIFMVMDTDGTGALNFEKAQEGLRKLNVHPRVHVSKEDWVQLTEGLAMDDDGLMRLEQFERMVREQLSYFVQRQTADAVAMSNGGVELGAMLSALKLILTEADETKRLTAELAQHSKEGGSFISSRHRSITEFLGSTQGAVAEKQSDSGGGLEELAVPRSRDLKLRGERALIPPPPSKDGAGQEGGAEMIRLQSETIQQQGQLLQSQSLKIAELDSQVREMRAMVEQSMQEGREGRDHSARTLRSILARLPSPDAQSPSRQEPPLSRSASPVKRTDAPSRSVSLAESNDGRRTPQMLKLTSSERSTSAGSAGGSRAHIQSPISPSGASAVKQPQVLEPPMAGMASAHIAAGRTEGPSLSSPPHPAFVNPEEKFMRVAERAGAWTASDALGANGNGDAGILAASLGHVRSAHSRTVPAASAYLAFKSHN